MQKSKYSYALIFIAAVLWGCISIFLGLLTDSGFTSIQAVFLRISVAAVVFSVYLLITDRSAFKIRLRDLPLFLGTGLVSLLFFNICYFSAIEKSSVAIAAVLLYTSPVFVMIMSAIFFKERITYRKLAALIVTFFGCVLVTGALGGGERITFAAFAFGIGSGFGYALYSIFGKIALRRYSSETVTLYTFIVAAIGSAFVADIGSIQLSAFTGKAALGAVSIGILCCVLPYIMYTKGLSTVDAGKAAITATVEPVVAAIVGVFVFREEVTISKAAGIILVWRP